jgi:hypothetical protein
MVTSSRASSLRDAVGRNPASTTLADDVLDGLTRPFKELPPKHL